MQEFESGNETLSVAWLRLVACMQNNVVTHEALRLWPG